MQQQFTPTSVVGQTGLPGLSTAAWATEDPAADPESIAASQYATKHDAVTAIQYVTDRNSADATQYATSRNSAARRIHAVARPEEFTIGGMDKWEGKILTVESDSFTAELTPIGRRGPRTIADFDISVLRSDAESAKNGDIFYLSVRRVRGRRGRMVPTVTVSMRRVGRWTQEEIDDLREQAARGMAAIEALYD